MKTISSSSNNKCIGIEIGESAKLLQYVQFSPQKGKLHKHFEINDAFGLDMKEHISRQKSGSTPLADQIVSKVKKCLDGGSARFPKLRSFNDENQPANVYGYRFKVERHGEVFLFIPHIFTKLFVKKFGRVAYDILKKADFLVTTKGRGNQYQTRIPVTGKQKSFIAIKASIR